MEISSLFKNALTYPLSSYKKLIILGIITLISEALMITGTFNNDYVQFIAGICGIISAILSLIIAGYLISVIKDTINGSEEIPSFDWISNFVGGIKYLIMSIVYFIIPIIIVLIVGAVTGLYGNAAKVIDYILPAITENGLNQTVLQASATNIPASIMNGLMGSLTVTAIVAIILAIIFTFFSIIGACRLADTDSLKEALNIKKVFNDISEIGWGSFIIWFIIWCIITLILGLISGFISMIPIIGIIISALIISPFITLFATRAMGLIYLEK